MFTEPRSRRSRERFQYEVQLATIFVSVSKARGHPRAAPLVSAVLGPPCNALWTITYAWVKGRYVSSNHSLQKAKLKHCRANMITAHLILVRGLLATIPACWPIGHCVRRKLILTSFWKTNIHGLISKTSDPGESAYQRR